jgi:hypothetical protein
VRGWIVSSIVAVAGLGGAVGYLALRNRDRPPPPLSAETPVWSPEPPELVSPNPAGPSPSPPAKRIPTGEEGQKEGEALATADLAQNRLAWRTLGGWGYPVRHHYEIVEMEDVLHRDFGVEILATSAGHGCFPPVDEQFLRARMDAYNAKLKPAIERKHGASVFAIARARAAAETEKNKAAYEREPRDPYAPPNPGACDPPYVIDATGVKRLKPGCAF